MNIIQKYRFIKEFLVLPTPTGNDTEEEFIGRCMGSEKMKNEFPDEQQRFAVCASQWGNNNLSKDKDVIIVDIDDTLIKPNGDPIKSVVSYINQKYDSYRIVVVTARYKDRRDETKKQLDDLGIKYDDLNLNDIGKSIGEGFSFKKKEAERLLKSYNVVEAIDNSNRVRDIYNNLGIKTINPTSL